MKKIFSSERLVPVALFIVCVISYGILIPSLGFYWDDWVYIWFAKTLGSSGFVDVFSHDRPFLALLYSINLPLLGTNPIVWQIAALIWRWLATLSFWTCLRLLWPSRPRQALWASIMFAVYPGFSQQWISVIYSEAFIILAAFFASLNLMMAALRKRIPFWPATIIALALSGFNLFSTEYFFGLELLRPLLIWWIIGESGLPLIPRIKRSVINWLPYMVVLAGFSIWRAFFFQSNTYQISAIESLASTPHTTIIDLLKTLGSNFVVGGWLAWNQIFSPPNALELQILTTRLYWLAVLAMFIFTFIFLTKVRLLPAESNEEMIEPQKWGWQAVLLGVLALLVGGIPFWIANLPLTLVFPWNRFTLALMPGSVLLLIGLFEVLIRTSRQKIILTGILVSLAAGWQFYNANTFRREWEASRDFFWQLSWRIPGLKPNTLLLTHEFPFKYYSDNSLTAPINWMYAPEFKGREMPYMLNYLSVRLKNSLPSARPDTPVEQTYRALTFKGNTSDSVALYLDSGGCLKVMDSLYTTAETIPGLPYKMEPAIPLSNLSRIETNPDTPAVPAPQYFPEQPHGWCYYYQKADLARQMGNWEEAARLGTEALEKKLLPATPSDWPLFIEVFGRVQNWNRAAELTENAYATNPAIQPALCKIWDRIAEQPLDDEGKASVKYAKSYIKCIDTGVKEN
ncbi:MAG: hypothetical protein GYA12_09665 [Chloroflexi bacterium]|nr:hypothetical protein [Chloroflexota bacterium]